jgi:FkbM family methyltransferase
VIYDVGANIGIYTIPAAKLVGATGRVYAFEPHSINFATLLLNIKANSLGAVVSGCNFALHDMRNR